MELITETSSPLILMDFSMTHSHMTNRHSSISSNSGAWLNSFVNLFPLITYHSHDESLVLSYCHPFLLLWVLFLCCIIISPWLRYCAYWGCTSWLIPGSFLTHIILHAGRIFRQRCRNHIVCLVVESALHVYKGQFSPWFGQFTIQTLLEFSYYGNAHTTKFINSASGTV